MNKASLNFLFTKYVATRPVQVICGDGETQHYLHEDGTWYPLPDYTVADLMPWLATFPKWRIIQYSDGYYQVTVYVKELVIDFETPFTCEHTDLPTAMLGAMLASKGFDPYAD